MADYLIIRWNERWRTVVYRNASDQVVVELPKCPAHSEPMCEDCAINGGLCADRDTAQCGFYWESGMHWDTCSERMRVRPWKR